MSSSSDITSTSWAAAAALNDPPNGSALVWGLVPTEDNEIVINGIRYVTFDCHKATVDRHEEAGVGWARRTRHYKDTSEHFWDRSRQLEQALIRHHENQCRWQGADPTLHDHYEDEEHPLITEIFEDHYGYVAPTESDEEEGRLY